MCISSNCGTAVDVVGPICQGPTKTPMGVQHPNEEPEGTYIPSQRAVVERIMTWNLVIHGALLMAACVQVCGDCW